MAGDDDLRQLARSADVVVFHSPVTDLGGLDEQLEESGCNWRAIEMGMGSSDSREQFRRLKAMTGRGTLPQVFVEGRFVGGLQAAQARLNEGSGASTAAAGWMGYLGLLPFLATAIGVWFGPAWAAGWLAAYGAVILAFVGAIYWGLAMTRRDTPPEWFYASVVPALVAWAALLVPAIVGLPVIAAGFIGWRVWESREAAKNLPRWFRRLRTVLTSGAVLALVGGWLALLPFTGTG